MSLTGVGDSLVFKIPVTNEGLKAGAKLAAKGKKTNIETFNMVNCIVKHGDMESFKVSEIRFKIYGMSFYS